MPLVNVVFNNLAAELIGDQPKARIRVKNGRLQFKPTKRVLDINLPEGERLRPITRTERRVYFSVNEDFLAPNEVVAVEKEIYGWFTLVPGDVDQRKAASAKLVSPVTTAGKRSRRMAQPLDQPNGHVSMP
jgi:hypothetical protein